MTRINCTQSAWVRRQLLAGKQLTHSDLIAAAACKGQGGHRLAAVIYTLRHKSDWPINSTAIPDATGPNPMVRYSTPTDWRPTGPMQLGLFP